MCVFKMFNCSTGNATRSYVVSTNDMRRDERNTPRAQQHNTAESAIEP